MQVIRIAAPLPFPAVESILQLWIVDCSRLHDSHMEPTGDTDLALAVCRSLCAPTSGAYL